MNVLSVFDGLSCAQLALKKAKIEYENYYASETNKYAIQVTQNNHPDTIQLGDVKNIKAKGLPEIGLLIGGSPCQSLSIANRQKESGLEKGKSILFWEFARLIKEVKPELFLLENVASMRDADRNIISETLGVYPIEINSALVSAQQRKRLYWTNIKYVTQPEDKGIYLQDILEKGFTERRKAYCMTATYMRACPQDYLQHGQRQMVFNKPVRIGHIGKGGQAERVYSIDGKSICLQANARGAGGKTGLYEIKKYVRKLTPIECERLQTIPDNYTQGISNSQRYKAIGNAFTVDVIAHILSFINFKPPKLIKKSYIIKR